MKLSTPNITRGVALSIIITLSVGSDALGQAPNHEQQKPQAQGANADNREDWTITGKEQAAAQARKIVGLLDKTPAKVTAKLVTLKEDNTPFLKNEIVGRPIWHVVIADWKLQLKSAPLESQDAYTRIFDVFVDSKNGRLLKLSSRWPAGVAAIEPQPPADFAEERMKEAGQEKYHAFPKTEPHINFLQALDVVFRDGVGNPLVAKQIVAHYVVRSSMGRKPQSVWAVTLRGIPPLKTAYPGVPIDARNHIRNIVDARTGKWLSAGTSPQPQATEETEMGEQTEPSKRRP